MNRRSFIFRMAGLASSCAGLDGASQERPPSRFQVIDVHIHTNFDDPDSRRQAAATGGVNFSPQGLLREMENNQVEQALSIGIEHEGTGIGRNVENPMLAELPPQLNRVGMIGGINPYRLDAEGILRLDRILSERRLKGLKIYLGYYHRGPDDDAYKRVYELAARHRVPVVFHTGDTYSPDAKVRFAHPLPIDDIAVDFREVTFVLAHLGNPWTMDAAELLYKNPNVYADLSGFLVGNAAYFTDPANQEGFSHVIERIRRAFAWVENPRKFMFGSDWPLVPIKPYLDLMRRAVPASAHEEVFYSNAKRVFGLD